MDIDSILKLVALIKGGLDALPALVASVKGTLKEEDEAKLKAALADIRVLNDVKYDEAQAALAARVAG
jgi:hypothetical protein